MPFDILSATTEGLITKVQYMRRRLMEGLGEEVQERARLMSPGLPLAGSWLTVAPILTLGLHMSGSAWAWRSTAGPAPVLPAASTATCWACTPQTVAMAASGYPATTTQGTTCMR